MWWSTHYIRSRFQSPYRNNLEPLAIGNQMRKDYEKLDEIEEIAPKSSMKSTLWKIGCSTLLLAVFIRVYTLITTCNQVVSESQCKVPDYVKLDSYNRDNSTLHKILFDEGFRNASAAKLSGAVQVKTDVGDDAPTVDENPEFWEEKFGAFHKYLQKTFPGVWLFAKIEKVNHWGLVITWEGSDPSLKPVLLSAHQDVVPTQEATLDQWKFPPYDGTFDGKYLWGRGSADCKNLLVGLLEAAEELHESGFNPRRTIIFAFGYDEEIGGQRGANYISQLLLQRYGKNGLYAVIDEGGQSLVRHGDVALALIGTSEKGMLNMKIGLNTPGGHSSVPPDHTSIGIVSELVTRLERNPFNPIFSSRNPTFYEYQCIAEYSNKIPSNIRKEIKKSGTSLAASKKVAEYIYNTDIGSRYLVTTSQAVDIIHGGVKSNALPEYVEVVVNHRIAVESSVDEVISHDFEHIKAVADEFNIGLIQGDKIIKPITENGYFTVTSSWELEPAPFTPIYDKHWALFTGTLRHVYEKICKGTMEDFEDLTVITAPGMAAGNTDTQYYWDLTEHIYRYRPGLTPSVQAHAHGANEHIPFNSHLQIIAFYFEYLQVVDAA